MRLHHLVLGAGLGTIRLRLHPRAGIGDAIPRGRAGGHRRQRRGPDRRRRGCRRRRSRARGSIAERGAVEAPREHRARVASASSAAVATLPASSEPGDLRSRASSPRGAAPGARRGTGTGGARTSVNAAAVAVSGGSVQSRPRRRRVEVSYELLLLQWIDRRRSSPPVIIGTPCASIISANPVRAASRCGGRVAAVIPGEVVGGAAVRRAERPRLRVVRAVAGVDVAQREAVVRDQVVDGCAAGVRASRSNRSGEPVRRVTSGRTARGSVRRRAGSDRCGSRRGSGRPTPTSPAGTCRPRSCRRRCSPYRLGDERRVRGERGDDRGRERGIEVERAGAAGVSRARGARSKRKPSTPSAPCQ